ncbi:MULTISPECIES: hypothetical protein [Spirulina sp. CCY15215]|uniref:hypothetical protein n=1 Tax=Spirulina sp. CCY15215 TaxID=2767591 RepID=UPI0019502D19|nr:hypothetical protein [Spirulina major]
MQVKEICEENWIGLVDKGLPYQCNELNQVKDAIKRLDGVEKTMLILSVDDDVYMTIAGGNNGRYICEITNEREDSMFALLSTSKNPVSKVAIVAGKQEGLYDSSLCLSLNEVFEASEFFCIYGKKNPNQCWKNTYES